MHVKIHTCTYKHTHSNIHVYTKINKIYVIANESVYVHVLLTKDKPVPYVLFSKSIVTLLPFSKPIYSLLIAT